jgi:predicted transcriptional regulator of viral defense system
MYYAGAALHSSCGKGTVVAIIGRGYTQARQIVALICHLWYYICMDFRRLVEIVDDEPVFATGLLLAGDVDPADVCRQLSRWTKSGRLYQLRRGLYALAPPFQKVKPHPFLVANHLVRGSYVSCQSALAHYGLIPEYVPVVTSVTTARPARWNTSLGSYEFHHIKADLLRGYRLVELSAGQRAFVALPEKALLDLIYLRPGGDSPDYLRELRLQNLDRLDLDELQRQADLARSPKLRRAAGLVADLARCEALEYETL